MHAALRLVQNYVPNFEELSLPPVYEQVIMHSLDGLILVCGVTGSGKSSTLAAMLRYINAHRSMHVITIEDPVEFTFRPQKCIISQREIGIDVANFAAALRYVVRQDPDCILAVVDRERGGERVPDRLVTTGIRVSLLRRLRRRFSCLPT